MTLPLTISLSVVEKRGISDVVREYGKRLWTFVRKKVQSNEDADDILQEVWYQLSNLADSEVLESTSGWLFHVARNKITDLYRKKKTDSLSTLVEAGDAEYSRQFQDGSDPAMDLFKEVFWEELMHALDELPANQREVFILNELDDKTLQEIADQTGENIKTIISRKGYAVKHLRRRLEYLYADLQEAY